MSFTRNLDRVRPIEGVCKTVLPSGLTLLVEEVPQVPSLTLGVWLRTGSRDEPPDLGGISHFIEHMVFKGTRHRSALQIAKKMEAIGGHLDAFTTREYICYYARVFEEHLSIAMEILSDLLCAPAFAREMIDRERRVVLEEIESYENNPEERALDLIAEHVWPNHPLGRSILGSPETIARFGARNVRRYHHQHYTAPNLVVAASGHVAATKLTELTERYFRFPSTPSMNGRQPLPRSRSRAVKVPRDVTQANLCLAGRGPSYFDEDRHALAIVNVILGAGLSSRLYRRIREDEGLAYSVYSFFDVLRDTGMFGLFLGVAPENALRSLDLACREIRKLKRDGVRRWELESAKAQLLMAQFLAYESTYDRMNRIAVSEICYGRQASLSQVVERIQSIDRDEVQEVLDRYMQPQRFSIVTLGPPGMTYPRKGDWEF